MNAVPYAEFELTAAQSRTLAEHLSYVNASPTQDFESFRMQVAEIMTRAAPADLTRLLCTVRSRSAHMPAVLLKNGPLPHVLPPTPSADASATPYNLPSTAFLVGCGLALGRIYGFANERGGALIHDIVPVFDKVRSRSSSGSRITLDLHSEVAFHHNRPDFVVLSCLRNPPTAVAATLVADAGSCLDEMAKPDVHQLQRPVFEFQVPHSFAAGTPLAARMLPIAVRRTYGWDVRINCNPDHTSTADGAAAEAMARLAAKLRAASRRIVLSPGQVLILDNKRSVHGREAYDTDYRGADRWLQRIYVGASAGHENPDQPPASPR